MVPWKEGKLSLFLKKQRNVVGDIFAIRSVYKLNQNIFVYEYEDSA